MFGFSEQEALGQSLDLIIPERLRRATRRATPRRWPAAPRGYGTDVLRVPALHKDGRSLSIAFTVSLLTAPTAG